MANNKVSNFSDLIQRVTSSCLLSPISGVRHLTDDVTDIGEGNSDSEYEDAEIEVSPAPELRRKENVYKSEREIEMEALMIEVFETVSLMKKAYVSMQQAHCPWDPDKMRSADVAVVAEMRKLGFLRERFRRRVMRGGGGGGGMDIAGKRTVVAGVTVREVVAPYEAAMEEMKTEVKSKQAEINNLKEKLSMVVNGGGGGGGGSNGRKSRGHQSKKKVNYSSQLQVSPSPMPEHFESCISSVKEASKSFTSLLLSLMKSSHWDIAAIVRSIEAATTTTTTTTDVTESIVGPNHAKYALESYTNRKLFQGFDHETFYMDGTLTSLLNPNQFRTECFTQYRDMKAMDPIELLGVLPTCQFGKFCSQRYISIVHPKMEESLFRDLEQRRQVLAGNHPRTRFYGEFLALAKAVWLLHLLVFSSDPVPSYFEGRRGAEFDSSYMESVVRFPGGQVGAGHVVGFSVSPGFKLGNGSVVKARVYVVPKSEL